MITSHKKIIISLSFALIVLLGAYYFGIYKSGPISYQKGGTNLIAEKTPTDNFLQADTDKDGLKYWEEALWKTDPSKADTDGDGTPDGEEAKAGRDPTIAGPDDKLKSIPVFADSSAETRSKSKIESSLTNLIARDLYTNYSILKQAGELSPENQTKINEALSASVEQIIKPKVYIASDLNIATSETPTSIKKYGNDVAVIINNNLKPNPQDEAVSLSNYLDKKNPADLKKVTDSAENYKKTISALLSMTVPPSVINEHLSLINSLNFFGKSIEGMAQVDTDPIVALVSLKNYGLGPEKIITSFRELISYFAQKRIVFTENEVGYIFTKGI